MKKIKMDRKKKIIIITAIIVVVLLASLVFILFMNKNRYHEVNVYLFSGETCPVCKRARTYLEELDEELDDKINLIEYEVWNSEENQANMQKVAKEFGDTLSGVPYIIVGEETFNGFSDVIGLRIKDAIESEMEKRNSQDLVAPMINAE